MTSRSPTSRAATSLPSTMRWELAKHDERKSQVIEMRFFGGLSLDETAEALHISPDTVKRDWKLAKAWLLRELRGDTSRTE